MGFQYHLIRIAGTYLTDDASQSGNRLISQISGLDKLRLARQVNVVQAIDGTPYRQFSSNKGLPISITFPLIPKATVTTIIDAMNNADNAGTNVSLYISGETGTFDLSVVPNGVSFPGTALQAGMQSVKFDFVVAQQNAIAAFYGTLTLTGQSATLTHS